jgi:EAL domain-containing protein (putative c-di-GMP-specific phosphodiesterase class I)
MPEESDTPGPDQDFPGLTEDLATALELNQFFLVYQPTIDLQTSAFAGVEALIRWHHPVHGIVGPERFIRELEATGGIIPVGRWALATACDQGALWHAKGYRFTVSVNISAKQFQQPDFVDDVATTLDASRFDSALLVLEFPQKTLTDDSATIEHLHALKELGVRLAIDDFMLGESTLSGLEQLPIDIVKLDRGSIASVAGLTGASTMVHELVQLAKVMGVQIIASGIENADQRALLALEDVSIGQGFYFSQPHEVDEIDRFLEDYALFSGRPL